MELYLSISYIIFGGLAIGILILVGIFAFGMIFVIKSEIKESKEKIKAIEKEEYEDGEIYFDEEYYEEEDYEEEDSYLEGYISGERNEEISNSTVEAIKKVDAYFNDKQFLNFAENTFMQLQIAWSQRNWEKIRTIESENLYEQHAIQVQEYIKKRQINVLEEININYSEFIHFDQDNEKDTIEVAVNSTMRDYIIKERTGKVLKGDKNIKLTNTYKLTFIRKKGITSTIGINNLKVVKCPNCGAPIRVKSSAKCEYCGSIIRLGAHNWVLGDYERL